MVFDKRIIGRLFPRHSRMLQALNENPLFLRWAGENGEGRVFPALPGPDALRAFHQGVHDLVAGDGGPIEYLEFGVATGRTLRLWSSLSLNARSRFYGFDSFLGLPEDWQWAVGGMPQGTFSTGGRMPRIRDRRVQCIRGLFQQTLPPFLRAFRPRHPLVVHLDCDLYSSTLFCLTQLDGILEGATVIFDEFDNLLHEFPAFRHYANAYRRSCRLVARWGYFKKAAIRIGGRL